MMTANPDSILDSIKTALGISSDYAAFDLPVVMHINTAFSTLRHLGVGPQTGFVITDNTSLWSSYSTDMVLLASVKSYIYAKVKLLFDPPPNSFGLDAMQKMVEELEWRLNVDGESIVKPSYPVFDTSAPYDPATVPVTDTTTDSWCDYPYY